MTIPLVDLGAQHEPILKEIHRALERVVESQRFILGPEVKHLEESVASYCGTGFAVGVSSGTDALLVSLMALGVGEGDEVVTTPYSFFATAGVIARVGARPIFADIDPETYNLDPEKLESCLTSRTKLILPVHLFGQSADMEPILRLAEGRGLLVVEDAAQAMGAEYPGGKRAGGMGALGCISFYPTKNLGALGDAGMVVTNDPELADRIRILRTHGASPKYHHRWVGGNFRLDELQAAVLRVKLKYLDRWTSRRQELARRYEAFFGEADLLGESGARLPAAVYEKTGIARYHTYNQFVIRVSRRDALREHLQRRGIATEVYYPVPLHLQPCFRYLKYREGDFPVAEEAARETLALPVYPELGEAQQREIVTALREFYLM